MSEDMFRVPSSLLKEFLKVSATNISSEDGKHLETLTFLLGFEENGIKYGTHLIFPRQQGQPDYVIDEGKHLIHQSLNILIDSNVFHVVTNFSHQFVIDSLFHAEFKTHFDS